MDSLLFLGAIIMMLWYSPLLTAAAILFALLPVAASFITGNRVAKAEKEISEKNESFMSVLRDGLSGFSVIKSFKAEFSAIKLFTESNKNVEEAKCRRKKGTALHCATCRHAAFGVNWYDANYIPSSGGCLNGAWFLT